MQFAKAGREPRATTPRFLRFRSIASGFARTSLAPARFPRVTTEAKALKLALPEEYLVATVRDHVVNSLSGRCPSVLRTCDAERICLEMCSGLFAPLMAVETICGRCPRARFHRVVNSPGRAVAVGFLWHDRMVQQVVPKCRLEKC